MARAGEGFLDTGDEFPSLSLPTVAGDTLELPGAFGEDWGVLLVYRAHW